MAGKSIYFTEKELEMINIAFQPGNCSFEGRDNEEECYEIADSIVRKTNKDE